MQVNQIINQPPPGAKEKGMTTENIVQYTDESRINQYKRDTLQDLLRISMDYQGPLKFVDVDVKAIANKVNEAYDQLGLQITTVSGSVNPLAGLVTELPGGNVMNMRPGSDASKTAPAATVALGGSSFKASKKEYVKFPEPPAHIIAVFDGLLAEALKLETRTEVVCVINEYRHRIANSEEENFAHFLSYTGFHSESPEVIKKLRKAYFDGGYALQWKSE